MGSARVPEPSTLRYGLGWKADTDTRDRCVCAVAPTRHGSGSGLHALALCKVPQLKACLGWERHLDTVRHRDKRGTVYMLVT